MNGSITKECECIETIVETTRSNIVPVSASPRNKALFFGYNTVYRRPPAPTPLMMDLMIDFEPFGKPIDLMRTSNEEILANENLTAGDVKQYLVNLLEAGRALESDAPSFLISLYRDTNRRLRKSLELWDSDRSECLFHLLHMVAADRRVGMYSSITASSRCAQVLLSEPLVPGREPQKYRLILVNAERALQSTLEKEAGSIKADLFLTYASGVQWNAMRFCPQIFDGSMGEEDVTYTRNRFLANLSSLQGLPPYVQ